MGGWGVKRRDLWPLGVCWCVPLRLLAAGARIGLLSAGTPEGTEVVLSGLRAGLREHGHAEGSSIEIEARYAHGKFERLPELARDLVGSRVDVLVTLVTQASIAAKASTKTIPIVMVGVSDPEDAGLVANLSRPGGNVTGTSAMNSETAGKRKELLKESVPGMQRVAVLWNPANRIFQTQLLQQTQAAARALGIQIRMFEAGDLSSIEKAFGAIAKEQVSALNILTDPTFVAHIGRIAALAQKARLPSVSGYAGYADAGGLIAYGPNYFELARSAAGYVAKILKGAKPGELPVERPTKFELVINLRTARQLGLAVPRSLLLRADRAIE
jgi:putative ABC transport system substrate-binding protein